MISAVNDVIEGRVPWSAIGGSPDNYTLRFTFSTYRANTSDETWDIDGASDALDVVTIATPNRYVLYQNYPNPFNPGTEIKFDLPKSGNVKIEIFNSLGERVAVLYDGYMEAGYGRSVKWNAIGYPSGVYYYRLIADQFVDVKKMVLMK